MPVTREDLLDARRNVSNVVHRTPVLTSTGLNAMYGCSLFFKCENFQKTGSFKMRGASNGVALMQREGSVTRVATHSSGNFAAALARAAATRNIPATIVMPRSAPQVKKRAVAGYGADIVECEPTLEARERTLADVVKETGATFLHPYDDPRVIAGQATTAMELMEDAEQLDWIVAPVGGGGLVSGTALAAHYFNPLTRVIGGEPEGADDAYRSIEAGTILPSQNPSTIADGLLTSLGRHTFPIIQEHVERIVLVDDGDIMCSLRAIWERMKIVVEPSAAVALAAVGKAKEHFNGARVGIILSGGNVDLDRLLWVNPKGPS
jgi:threonine dehydratase